MLSSLTTGVMLLAMVLHAAFGCHWHHAHAPGEHANCGDRSMVADCSHRHGHHTHDSHGDHASHGEKAPETPAHGNEDCGEECVFLGVPAVVAPSLDTVWTGTIAADLDAGHPVWRAWNLSERNRNNLFYGDASPSAQRPVLCIWLI